MTDVNNEPMGVLLINKPQGWTSFDVCGKLRGILHQKRIGHTGTLDPLATGVLPILIGKAAKVADILPESGKEYRAHFKLGIDTDTQDITGKVLATDSVHITKEQLEQAFVGFVGDYMQTPPMYSAVKVDGKKLCDLAREGKEIKREPKLRHIDYITLESFDEEQREGVITLSVSKGTYIRTLICDAAKSLGTLGTMTELVRTKACGFTLDECITLEQAQALADEGKLTERILRLESIFSQYPKARLDEKRTKLYKNGVKLRPEQAGIKKFDDNSRFCVMADSGELISVAYTDKQKNELRALRNFY